MEQEQIDTLARERHCCRVRFEQIRQEGITLEPMMHGLQVTRIAYDTAEARDAVEEAEAHLHELRAEEAELLVRIRAISAQIDPDWLR